MGHLTNPTGFRVGKSIRWPYKWSSDKLSYASYIYFTSLIFNYVNNMFSYIIPKIKKMGLVLSHLRLSFTLSKIFLRIFLYSRDYLRMCKKRYAFFISRAKVYMPSVPIKIQKNKIG